MVNKMIISKTPVRISFFGGGTDYPDYYKRFKGAVIGTTINKYIYLSINKLNSFFDHKIKLSYSKSELVNEFDEIEHPSIRECLKYINLPYGLDIHVFADLPARTGLGSSSSFTVGLLNVLYELQKKQINKKELAIQALHIEQQLIQERVGSQDQIHAAFGGLNLIEFDSNNFSVTPIKLTQENLSVFEESLLLFYTGINRYADQILEEQIHNTKQGSKDQFLDEMFQMVYKAKEILLTSKSNKLVSKLGDLLHQSWELKKQLSSKISNTLIDNYYQKALKAGAHGGKLCGAGHGGFLLIMAEKNQHQNIRNALKDLLEVEFKFEKDGTQIIYQH